MCAKKKLTLGFSPCPNDTYMMDALVHHRLEGCDETFDVRIADVEELNRWALDGRLDVTKVSFHTYLMVMQSYTLLESGAALGFGCGPLLIAREALDERAIERGPVAIPGEHTTAHLLFRLRYPGAHNKEFVVFSDVEKAVLDGNVVAGVIIHENRFTYADKGLALLEDLGAFWERETSSPIPLGAFIARRALGAERIGQVQSLIRASVASAMKQPERTMPFVRKHAQEMDPEVMQQHIAMYVNAFSLDLGDDGRKAVEILRAKARDTGLAVSF